MSPPVVWCAAGNSKRTLPRRPGLARLRPARRRHFVLTGLGSDWNQYRYKTAQSIVPVRNLIWGQQN
jgi:hypothetical protein